MHVFFFFWGGGQFFQRLRKTQKCPSTCSTGWRILVENVNGALDSYLEDFVMIVLPGEETRISEIVSVIDFVSNYRLL